MKPFLLILVVLASVLACSKQDARNAVNDTATTIGHEAHARLLQMDDCYFSCTSYHSAIEAVTRFIDWIDQNELTLGTSGIDHSRLRFRGMMNWCSILSCVQGEEENAERIYRSLISSPYATNRGTPEEVLKNIMIVRLIGSTPQWMDRRELNHAIEVINQFRSEQ